MPIRNGYTNDQERSLATALRADAPLSCPECAVALDRRPVPPRSDVSYVRDRVLLVCPACRRTAVIDRRAR